ncbi:MAG: hypothetical protein R3F43_01475 [bacterium]
MSGLVVVGRPGAAGVIEIDEAVAVVIHAVAALCQHDVGVLASRASAAVRPAGGRRPAAAVVAAERAQRENQEPASPT